MYEQTIKFRKNRTDKEHNLRVFTLLMLKGQVRAAVSWLTERLNDNSVLNPSSFVSSSDKTVLKGLREKYLEPFTIGEGTL